MIEEGDLRGGCWSGEIYSFFYSVGYLDYSVDHLKKSVY